ncbi:uncharacterized protein Z518_10807 [Rhinocladiella mackenziei CBS 650.93]|uniref:Triacylglycerol lipase n=1 Tax=Rhinocladiella mackenziei CBS 650.93 TaxID=1442369 RepID=A0A0D2IT20_9EURO|nr:uncharacterized protein Z518_10807 [Rhinocladiella mackenziei CBS 650.93]KIW99879.1 hypothetical protein Z518_10807 [Rhinocladiella mackenziei CBS 650.93]
MPFSSSIIVIFALFFALVTALPFSLGRRAVSQDLLNQLSFFEQYSAAAYCPDNNIPTSSTTITCSAGNCPQVQAAGAQSILEFQNVGLSDATGFVALDHTNQLIVISFRGSQSIQNFIADLTFVMVPWSLCTDCTAHAGFLDSWNGVKSQVQGAIDGAKLNYSSYQIVATGHSLGGALATLAAAELRDSGHSVSLYTYGSPMVGNAVLANFTTAQSGGNYRVTHAQDIVPKLPGYFLGFAHVSPEYWITSPTDAEVTANDVQVSSGVINLQGNQGQLESSVEDHLWYFNSISACGPDGIEVKA